MKAPSLANSLMDRLILPGALGFTRFGYACRKRNWAGEECTMKGRTVVVTGSNSELGLATSRSLAERGARVVLVGRNPDKAERVRQDVIADSGNENVTVQLADLCL